MHFQVYFQKGGGAVKGLIDFTYKIYQMYSMMGMVSVTYNYPMVGYLIVNQSAVFTVNIFLLPEIVRHRAITKAKLFLNWYVDFVRYSTLTV